MRRHFSGLRERRSPANGRPPRAVTRVVTRSKRELEQVHLCLGAAAYPQTHHDRYRLPTSSTPCSGAPCPPGSSRTSGRSGASSTRSPPGVTAYSDAGLLSIYAGTSRESAREVIRLTLEEVRRLCGEKLGEEELRRAKDHLKGSLVLSLEYTGAA